MWNTSRVASIDYMFRGCSRLKNIYVYENWNLDNVSSACTNMFVKCSILVGGNGTAYTSSNTNKTYARIDTTSTPGYFTLKTN